MGPRNSEVTARATEILQIGRSQDLQTVPYTIAPFAIRSVPANGRSNLTITKVQRTAPCTVFRVFAAVLSSCVTDSHDSQSLTRRQSGCRPSPGLQWYVSADRRRVRILVYLICLAPISQSCSAVGGKAQFPGDVRAAAEEVGEQEAQSGQSPHDRAHRARRRHRQPDVEAQSADQSRGSRGQPRRSGARRYRCRKLRLQVVVCPRKAPASAPKPGNVPGRRRVSRRPARRRTHLRLGRLSAFPGDSARPRALGRSRFFVKPSPHDRRAKLSRSFRLPPDPCLHPAVKFPAHADGKLARNCSARPAEERGVHPFELGSTLRQVPPDAIDGED